MTCCIVQCIGCLLKIRAPAYQAKAGKTILDVVNNMFLNLPNLSSNMAAICACISPAHLHKGWLNEQWSLLCYENGLLGCEVACELCEDFIRRVSWNLLW